MDVQKYSGAGNSFIITDNRNSHITDYYTIVIELMKKYPGTDGVIFLENSGKADFKMNYFNRDGTGDALCGNGLRCIVKFISDNGISDNCKLRIEAVSQIYESEIISDNEISIRFPPPVTVKTNFRLKVHFQEWWELLKCSYVDIGSPHIVVFTDDIEKPKVNSIEEVNIDEWGRNIRMHKDLMPEGANVNFAEITGSGELAIRSFERGVEAETLACGTGSISAALIYYITREQIKPVRLLTRSGQYLKVDFEINEKKLKSITLSGEAEKISF
ncbi:MAG TPA: diaminopimelate epimerase [Ignavibacteria bacterium]|nr:diaminopimelate epimerase [Bacteroidota bacterium]HRI84373.1 diaminopimelate epimerase [Ignavibacteria bacterium]HRJ99344.1 diaminopimelate epimerase [Ignavibacteria bacterium]